MAFAQGSRFSVGIQAEATYGVAPVSPALVELPATSFGLNTTKTLLKSDNFSASGQRLWQRHGNSNVAGDIAIEFADSDFDVILEGVMHNAFSAGVLKHGTGIKSYHVEARHVDVSNYSLFKGAVVSQLALNSALDDKVKGVASFIAKEEVVSGTSFDATMTAAALTPAFTGHEVSLTFNSVALKPSSFALTINNNMEGTFALGSDVIEQVNKGFIEVSGTFEAYLADSTLQTAFLAETEAALQVVMSDGVNSYTFDMAKVKLNSAEKTVAGQGAVVLSVAFAGVYDSGSASTLVITKA